MIWSFNRNAGSSHVTIAHRFNFLNAILLSQRIEGDYAGTFGQLRDDANTTSQKLSEIIGEVRSAAGPLGEVRERCAARRTPMSINTWASPSSGDPSEPDPSDPLTSITKRL